jgi:hypothetical protein
MRRRAHIAVLAPIAMAVLTLAGCASAPAPVAVAPPPPAPPPIPTAPPPLIVAISVDQFGADLFAQYRQNFMGGLARLTEGAVFASAYQSHAATETCPGHSTLLTGVHPARNGIIANTWFDTGLSRADKKVYCAEDESDPTSTSKDPVVSAKHLKVPTLGEWLKQADAASRNVAVSAKDRSAVMMGGHAIDQAYWYKGGRFVTFRGLVPGPAAMAENTALADLLTKGALGMMAPEWCAARVGDFDVGRAGVVGAGRFALAPGQPDALRVSPRMDAATLNLAAGLVDELRLGRGAAPDVLSIGLSATDYIGHAYGNQGLEMCIQMAELDRTLGTFFAKLDAAEIDYAVMLTADHGGLDAPERLGEQALPQAVRVDPALTPAALDRAIKAQLGIAGETQVVYGDGPFGDFYVNKALAPDLRAKAIASLAARLGGHAQVAAAFTASDLAKAPLPAGSAQDWTLRDRARASFDAARSGDVVALLDRAVVPIPEPGPGFIATHGSAWDYDRRVPLLFWRKGLPGFEQPAPVETVDIAPTLAALVGLSEPAGTWDGRCLDIYAGEADSCSR